jgi:hypothetical protein
LSGGVFALLWKVFWGDSWGTVITLGALFGLLQVGTWLGIEYFTSQRRKR